jgi:hypothetical protein
LLSTLRSCSSLCSSRALRAAVMLMFALGTTALLMGFAPTTGASAASFRCQAGYTIQSGWLCYGWSNGALHCTQRWRRDASGKLIAVNPMWAPNVGGAPASNPVSSSRGRQPQTPVVSRAAPACTSTRQRPPSGRFRLGVTVACITSIRRTTCLARASAGATGGLRS